jgi:hemin uptake protein HemP
MKPERLNGSTVARHGSEPQQRSAGRADPRPPISSRELLGGGQELQILHAGSIYRLRVTSNGKLILTK